MNRKVYDKIMSGDSDNNIKFTDFRNLIVDLGFSFTRQTGSHRQYLHREIGVFMNIQDDGSKAKAYEVKQLRKIIKQYGLYGG